MVQQTSLVAFLELLPQLGKRQKEVFELLEQYRGLTNTEIARILRRPINVVVPRVFELRQKGLVVESGRRVCGVTGRVVLTWKVRE